MTKNNKIFILLPDGVGLRNFAYSNFYELGIKQGYDVVFWNNTPFQLANLGYNEIEIKNAKTHPLTEIYKNARKHIELNLNIKKSNDKVYNSYRFPFSYNKIKSLVKNLLTLFIINTNSHNKGLEKVREKIKKQERNTAFYSQCLERLKLENPAMVFCTNQRTSLAIAPILAAQDLEIPTATFIFSWDNIPKATMVIETNYYFVWSNHMKEELLYYYSYIKENQIIVTGTPQFESHFDLSKTISTELFFEQYKLDLSKKYICYSGDDSTTCPDDPQYLNDVAKAVAQLNEEGFNLGIIFRRCPVDFSNRYDNVLQQHSEIIKPIAPLWQRKGGEWNTILPTQEDVFLLLDTIKHTEFVINLGSSMVFDYAAFKKPCMYINYDVPNKILKEWTVEKIYKYVHFQSMPSKESVIWINNSNEIKSKIKNALEFPNNDIIENAENWFKIIVEQPPNLASIRIWNAIKKII